MFFAKPIPLSKDMAPNDNAIKHIKRQVRPSTSVVHVTITAAGTVVYTHTATSYSFIPSYTTISPTASSTYNGTEAGASDSHSSSSSPNLGAIIGGAVGGAVFIALIGLAFLFMRRSKKKKMTLQTPGGYIDDTDSYYQRGADMTSAVPAPRHLVAPLSNDGNESKYFQHNSGYYDDMVSSPPGNYVNPNYYSTTTSITSDSSPSTTVDGRTSVRHISNLNPERHVPHLKDRIEEPPHSKD